jgi:hypothetical protein
MARKRTTAQPDTHLADDLRRALEEAALNLEEQPQRYLYALDLYHEGGLNLGRVQQLADAVLGGATIWYAEHLRNGGSEERFLHIYHPDPSVLRNPVMLKTWSRENPPLHTPDHPDIRRAVSFLRAWAERIPTAKRAHMTKESANKRAMELARVMGKTFFLLSESEQARQIGCTWRTWSKTEFYQKAQKRRGKLATRPTQGKRAGSPRTVSFTSDLEKVTGEGDREEVLERLAAEQRADDEGSPLDGSKPRKIHCRKRL